MQEIVDDDCAYAVWLNGHPMGFVLNARRNAGPGYTVIHRASCPAISRPRDDGAYTGRGYRKVVADTVDELRGYTRSLGRKDGSFSTICSKCRPLGN